MSEINHPILETKKIIKATIVSLIIAVIILITAVLPAEYGIDPIGSGKLFGFSELYQPDEKLGPMSSAKTVLPESYPLLKLEDVGSDPQIERPLEADRPAPAKQLDAREDTIQIRIPAGKGLEYKISMLKYGKLKYEWATDNGTLFFDFHGDVKLIKSGKNDYFESYTVAYANNMVGSLLSPFEGKHGWYFKNKGKKDIVVNLRLKGQYVLIN